MPNVAVNEPTDVRFLVCARARAGAEQDFERWSGRLQKTLLSFDGSLSCEFWPPTPPDQEESVVVMRFDSVDALRRWRTSETYRSLLAEAAPLVEGGYVTQLTGGAATEFYVQNSATEVIVTDVKPGKEAEYRNWASRIDTIEASFPGFRGSYMQPPTEGEKVWTTLLRFDTKEKLAAWIASPERASLLTEADNLVDRVLVHRVDTSFPGWVPPDPTTGKPPPSWKTAMLVLLVLFPVVMLEMKFLNPQLRSANRALGTFIGNAISVALTTWPLMPLAIAGFAWWLYPGKGRRWTTAAGPLALALCFAIEIAIFSRLL
jgi:antibiotic biosynthesis monooxygenase (ABM) superfamily enzyme